MQLVQTPPRLPWPRSPLAPVRQSAGHRPNRRRRPMDADSAAPCWPTAGSRPSFAPNSASHDSHAFAFACHVAPPMPCPKKRTRSKARWHAGRRHRPAARRPPPNSHKATDSNGFSKPWGRVKRTAGRTLGAQFPIARVLVAALALPASTRSPCFDLLQHRAHGQGRIGAGGLEMPRVAAAAGNCHFAMKPV